ncbi:MULTISPECIES: right-handed parallel beta-helix repeat-containing protein [Salinibaculum]|uniref:right-handed parallel beta-helix repeat-containing protein n=1 Tax=Salinibaculum TaxID=2732368 RepID=UPI0030D3A450
MDRRTYLKALGAAGVAGLAGCATFDPDGDETPEPGPGPKPTETETATATATPTETPRTPTEQIPHTGRFDTVVDLAEAGADTEANESVVDVLEDNLTDDTLVYLPPGRYLVDRTMRAKSFVNLGIVGKEATIVPEPGFGSVFFDLGRPGQASDLLFEDVTFDFREPGVGSRPVSALVDDGLVVRNLFVTGRQDTGQGMLRVDVTDADGTGLVENLQIPDGAVFETSSNGVLVGDNHTGTIRFENCRVEGFPDNGLYADPQHGSVEVVGGYYANSNIANVRIGNDSVVRDVHVRCDAAPDQFSNMRGIRITHGDGAVVEDCTVEMRRVAGSDGGITFGKGCESATVKDTRIRVDADNVNAVQIKHPEGVAGDERIELDSLKITGGAASSSAVEVHQRRDCTFKNLTIKQSGDDRDGFLIDRSTAAIRDCWVEVTGQPIVTMGDSTAHVVDSYPPNLNS